MTDHCTCRPGRDHDGSEFGPCEFCERPEPLCKADGKPLCEPCWREGRCMGEVTWDFRSGEPKRWRSAEAAAYGYVD
jgi:hypothetical protein